MKLIITESQLKNLIRKVLIEEENQDLEGEDMVADIKNQYSDASVSENQCRWDITQPGIKIFFDITGFSDEEQNVFGKGIILRGAIANWFKGKFKNSLNVVNHVGFVFSDGSIMHASNHGTGVMEEPADSEDAINIMSKPKQYTVLNLGGDENSIREQGRGLISKISDAYKTSNKSKSLYDFKGIGRQLVGSFLSKWIFKEKDSYQFYCSEFVANLLTLSNIISVHDLKKITNESLSELDKYDDVTPTELFKLIVKKGGKPVNLICFNEVTGTKKVQVIVKN